MATGTFQVQNLKPAKQVSVDNSQSTTTRELSLQLSDDDDIAFAGILMISDWDTHMSNQYIGGLFCRQNVNGYSLVDIVPNNTNKPTISYDKSTKKLTLTFSSTEIRFVRLIYT